MTDLKTSRPVPVPYKSAEPFWAATREGRLTIQLCANGHRQFYPRGHCRTCGSRSLQWLDASGSGTIHTFSVVHRAGHDGFADRLPYVFAIVELTEGPRVTANIVGIEPSEVRIGMPVQATFSDAEQDVVLVQFAPTGERSAQ